MNHDKYYLSLKTGEAGWSEAPLHFYQTKRRQISKHSNAQF